MMHDASTEKSLVRCALGEPSLFGNTIKPGDIFTPEYRAVWQAGRDLHAAGRAIDLNSLAERLEAANVAQPATLLADLFEGYEPAAYAETYAQTVTKWARYRDLVATWAQIQATSTLGDGNAPDVDSMINALQERFAKLKQAERAERYKIFGAAEALQQRPPIEYLIDPLIAPSTVSLFFGEPGSGKTYAIADMAVCVATGATWVGLPTKQTPVLLVDEESGPRRLQDRLGFALRGHEADAQTPVSCVSLAGFNFREQADLHDLQGLIEQTGAGLVLVDALADVMLGGDENSVADTQPVFHGLRVVADATGAAIVVIHHTNRAGTFRGSSAIPGAVDTMIEFARRKGSEFLADIQTTKNRDGKPIKLSAMMRWSDDMFDMFPALEAPKSETFSKSERYVLRYLADHAQATVKDVMENADSCAPTTARTALYNLIDRGKARRCDGKGQGTEARFELVADGNL